VGQIIVGYDGSGHALAAVRWAGHHAGLRGGEVVLLESWHEAVWGRSLAEAWHDPLGEERTAREALEAVAAEAAAAHPGVSFSSTLVSDGPADALVAASAEADLVVVGARGRGGFASLLLGSVSQRVAVEAASSVVVVRSEPDPTGPVVVGVDGSAASRAALRWAAGEARARGVALRAVMAWHPLAPLGAEVPAEGSGSLPGVDVDGILAAAVAEELGADPAVELELVVVRGTPAKALVERGSDASLLVVGRPSSPSASGRFGGSACTQLLHHAPAPLAIVRA
jgi:nucleotide-binding universal stress UspA family protein